MTARPITRIAIAGGGVAAWAAALAFARRLPGTQVTVVPTDDAPCGMADRFGTMQVSARDFHLRAGIDERKLLATCGGAFRLGTRFDGWMRMGGHFVRPIGGHGRSVSGVPFHQAWIAAAHRGAAPAFDRFSPAAALISAGRFRPPAVDARSPFWGFDVAIAVDPAAYREVLRQAALAANVATASRLCGVSATGERVTGLHGVDGETIDADLYVDASGSAAALLSSLEGGDARRDWSHWLPNDRVQVTRERSGPELIPADIVMAERVGWRLTSDLPAGRTIARVYSSRRLKDETVARALGDAAERLEIRPGRRAAAWIGNCVAIGDAAVECEPLEAPHCHLIHAAIDRILNLLPDTEFAPLELARYNREWGEEADRLRDFLILHHAVSGRNDPCWKRLRDVELPDELNYALALFRERGRLPLRNFGSFGPEAWYAVLLGASVLPRHADALADNLTAQQFASFADTFLGAMATELNAAPRHDTVLARLRSARAA
ncbi:tryptophan 7-halogenase [Stakelama saccharophila]|uniref:Tryptophan 7-halogenase n=1 Tax=Stakelama saccharophila TaxID=3075605 RepID=A0ABZ0B4P0_9SPHN|nr:tryptophan 7-halogenase [Stakelama sp. W311]WNO52355.1 tryptophan 7-halogenase [Stakelama sp. W311]